MSSETSYTATLIAKPGSGALTNETALRCSAAIQATGVTWLSDSQALDLAVTGNRADITAKLSETIGEQPIDVAIQPSTIDRSNVCNYKTTCDY